MKLGLDIHGVIDKDPDKYSALARSVRMNGGKVIIITGQSDTPTLRARLSNLGIIFDEFASIQDQLLVLGAEIIGYEETRPIFKTEQWNNFKGAYCAMHNVDLMIDDSPEYRQYFTTPFLLA